MSPPSPPDPAPAADGPDWTGRVIAGRYRVDEVLGVGGMGTAYRARDLRTDRVVVLKVPHSKHFSEEESRARFQDEVRNLLQIEHLHVVKVFDVGEEGGEPFAVFQHLAGGNLKTKIQAAGGRLAPDEIVPWLTQIADALDDLHARGDIHRDVKPDNILFDKPTATGRSNAFLADFGLAKALGMDPSRVFQSRTGTLVGTQAYMAPEQFNREAPASGAVDQYALATTVYQALSHEMPFAVSSAEELVFEKVAKSPRPLTEVAKHVPAGAAAAVMRALSAKPTARFPSCGEFARAFAAGLVVQETREAPAPLPPRRVAETSAPGAARVATGSRAPAPARDVSRRGGESPDVRRRSRWPWIAAVAATLGGLGGAGAFLGWFGGGDAPSRRGESAAVPPTPVPVPVAGAGMETPTPTPPSPAPVTPPAMEADPVPAGMATVPPAEPAMVETPPAPPVVPVAPAWKAHMDAAKAAARSGDWIVAGRELDLALEKEVPAAEVPKSLEDGVRDWKAPATLTITAPADPSTVTAETVEVRWTLSTPRAKDVASVTSNGKAVTASSPGRTTVSLVEGENRIEIVVRDEKGGERAKESVRVIREKDVAVVPPWAKVSPDQIAEAKRQKVPVAFENSIGMRLVLVPSGTFTMGLPEGEMGQQSGATRHRVTLTQPYYVSIHEATNGQFRRFKKEHDSGKENDESLNGDTQPVVNVSHMEAVDFAMWLSGRETGRTYRLPTESEWEYAARAATTTSRYWGDDEGGFVRNANVADAKTKAKFSLGWEGTWDDGFAATAPVGTYLPNGWGLFDMLGNVWEWCADWNADYPTGAVTDPAGPLTGSVRVKRGGSWHGFPETANAMNRFHGEPDRHGSDTGFRLVLPARASR